MARHTDRTSSHKTSDVRRKKKTGLAPGVRKKVRRAAKARGSKGLRKRATKL